MKGYDTYFEEAGKTQERFCQVCGSKCQVKRDQTGPTGWIEAMANHTHLHDFFYCPHTNKDWHKQALKIVLAIEESPSKRIVALMQQDLLELLAEHDINTDLSFKEKP